MIAAELLYELYILRALTNTMNYKSQHFIILLCSCPFSCPFVGLKYQAIKLPKQPVLLSPTTRH